MADFASIATALGLGGVLGALARAQVDRATDFRNRMIGAADQFLEKVGSTRSVLLAASETLLEDAKLKAFLSAEDDIAAVDRDKDEIATVDEDRPATSTRRSLLPSSHGDESVEHAERSTVADDRSKHEEVVRDVDRSLSRFKEKGDLSADQALEEIEGVLAKLRQTSAGTLGSPEEAEEKLAQARVRLKLREAFDGLGAVESVIPRLEVLFPSRGRRGSLAAVHARALHAALIEEWFNVYAAVEGEENSDSADVEEVRAAFTADVNRAIRRWLL
jgi:hypothetical protein